MNGHQGARLAVPPWEAGKRLRGRDFVLALGQGQGKTGSCLDSTTVLQYLVGWGRDQVSRFADKETEAYRDQVTDYSQHEASKRQNQNYGF